MILGSTSTVIHSVKQRLLRNLSGSALRPLAQKITKRIHSSKPASLHRPIHIHVAHFPSSPPKMTTMVENKSKYHNHTFRPGHPSFRSSSGGGGGCGAAGGGGLSGLRRRSICRRALSRNRSRLASCRRRKAASLCRREARKRVNYR